MTKVKLVRIVSSIGVGGIKVERIISTTVDNREELVDLILSNLPLEFREGFTKENLESRVKVSLDRDISVLELAPTLSIMILQNELSNLPESMLLESE